MNLKLKEIKRRYINHYNTFVLAILNSSKPSEKDINLLKSVINGILRAINNQQILIRKDSKKNASYKNDYFNNLKSQSAKLNESLELLKNIHINKNKLVNLRYDFEKLYEEEKSFYS